ncbi:alternative oxidase [Dissoconium aciculare CBS 342.82]|uniref:Alternative oxidase n=1 Tax=Dissoconium aciculare CBS 342.82 TaxID=1314786 RepID=A0A6J3M140_9PEZI|nr:alternative oxidase [Dissoconium aciculare CBS 342.82]KAF1820637.1 alternative oxidase [Dissoconium aciculare CBS 342.82]
MNCTRSLTVNAFSAKQSAAQLLKALNHNGVKVTTLARPALLGLQNQSSLLVTPTSRPFSTTQASRMKDFFPQPETENIRQTPPAWPHPGFTKESMELVAFNHRQPRDWPDRIAYTMTKILRFGLDLATGYRKDKVPTAHQYMVRNVFLESVAGVPGMVAGMLRHMHSMRRMKRDNGWMETLLEESYNERMHLLTFLKMAEPGWFMRFMVLATQGVFFNAFFISYLIAPKICHRFVGYLEEEAVYTYTKEIAALDAGHLPEWEGISAPDIAVKYWNMPEGNRSMRDLLLYIRADESKHREVNHTLGNLDQKNDPNPYVSEYKDTTKPHPNKRLDVQKPAGWERDEVL